MMIQKLFYAVMGMLVLCILGSVLSIANPIAASPKTKVITPKCFVIEGETQVTCGLPKEEFDALVNGYNAASIRAIKLESQIKSGCLNNT
jgi:hypothetical protein